MKLPRPAKPDVIVIIRDGTIYDVYGNNEEIELGTIDLDTGDIADDRDYEDLKNNPNYTRIDWS